MDLLRSRQYQRHDSYAQYRLSNGELNLLAAELEELDSQANFPVKLVVGKDPGDDWHLAYGYYCREGEEGEVHVTTDHVHCSEIRGDALDDARVYVTVRNNLPGIIAALEELLTYRLDTRP